jgi:putative zinc finger/helix-turn-helix YgiT family protein
MAKRCHNCGSEQMQERHGNYRFDPPPNIPGGVMIISDATWVECGNCGEQLIPAALSRKLEELSIIRQGLLPPSQIKAVREKLGLTQTAMAERLGVGEKTYTRWESGRSIQNKSSDNLIRLMDRSPEQFAVIEAQRDAGRAEKIAEYFRRLGRQEGRSRLAMAAHDAELTPDNVDRVREALRKAVEDQKQQ